MAQAVKAALLPPDGINSFTFCVVLCQELHLAGLPMNNFATLQARPHLFPFKTFSKNGKWRIDPFTPSEFIQQEIAITCDQSKWLGVVINDVHDKVNGLIEPLTKLQIQLFKIVQIFQLSYPTCRGVTCAAVLAASVSTPVLAVAFVFKALSFVLGAFIKAVRRHSVLSYRCA
jgi:hypothetical protein